MGLVVRVVQWVGPYCEVLGLECSDDIELVLTNLVSDVAHVVESNLFSICREMRDVNVNERIFINCTPHESSIDTFLDNLASLIRNVVEQWKTFANLLKDDIGKIMLKLLNKAKVLREDDEFVVFTIHGKVLLFVAVKQHE